MIRWLWCLFFTLILPATLAAQPSDVVARVDTAKSSVQDGWFGGTEITLHLSEGVPFRVFTLSDPHRLVLDFRMVDWTGINAGQIKVDSTRITDLRFGLFQPGWSRMVLDLAMPMLPDRVALPRDPETGGAVLGIALKPVTEEAFLAASGPPKGAFVPRASQTVRPPPATDGKFVVVIDPGHGGIDPGAERGEIAEKNLMLDMALTLRELLRASGEIEVILTREEDIFVSLQRRVAIAHQVNADVFVSLHADSLSAGAAHGATVYTLSENASDAASAQLAARHNRADVIAGVDLTGADDEITGVLLDIARQETDPRSAALAHILIRKMETAGGPMNRRPFRQAGFAVLKSADIPSVLIEVGFLSSDRDLANLTSPVWRETMLHAIANALQAWKEQDDKRPSLKRP